MVTLHEVFEDKKHFGLDRTATLVYAGMLDLAEHGKGLDGKHGEKLVYCRLKDILGFIGTLDKMTGTLVIRRLRKSGLIIKIDSSLYQFGDPRNEKLSDGKKGNQQKSG